jgi:hypothetical protein
MKTSCACNNVELQFFTARCHKASSEESHNLFMNHVNVFRSQCLEIAFTGGQPPTSRGPRWDELLLQLLIAWTKLGQHHSLHLCFRLSIVPCASYEHWESFRERRFQSFTVLQMEVWLTAKLAFLGFDVVIFAGCCCWLTILVDLLRVRRDLRDNVGHVSDKDGQALRSLKVSANSKFVWWYVCLLYLWLDVAPSGWSSTHSRVLPSSCLASRSRYPNGRYGLGCLYKRLCFRWKALEEILSAACLDVGR